jgi:DNA modification methylase
MPRPAGMVVVTDAGLELHHGDCRAILPTLPADSVHCVVTSPPYWGLRDYGVEGQLGLEPTPEAYVATMVAVFREVRRVLRADGTLWMNMGDSYVAQPPGACADPFKTTTAGGGRPDRNRINARESCAARPPRDVGALKQKDLVGIPWRLAFALQADGWYLRADIIWAKPNPMPESVTDRPTKAHEYVFLLTKSARYFYDADAVREDAGIRPLTTWAARRETEPLRRGDPALSEHVTRTATLASAPGRNLRSVWSIPAAPFPDAHFATFPPALAARCIQAGSSEKGCCRACGAPWARLVEMSPDPRTPKPYSAADQQNAQAGGTCANSKPKVARAEGGSAMPSRLRAPVGWAPTCPCPPQPPIPCTVLDPFAGAGTVGAVAESLGRRALLIELSAPYIQMAQTRTAQRGLFTHHTTCTPTAVASTNGRSPRPDPCP